MFSWICPQCGRDVPPSKTDCPFCAEQAKEAAALAAAGPPEAQTTPWQQPPPGYGAPSAPGWPPQQQYAPSAPSPQAPPHQAPPQYSAPQYPPPHASQPAPPSQPQYAPQPSYNLPPPQYNAPPRPQAPAPAAWHPPASTRTAPPTWLVAVGFAAVLLLLFSGVYYFFLRTPGTSADKQPGLENPSNASKQKVSNPLQKYLEVVGLRMITQDKKPVAKFVLVNHSATEIDNLAANVTLWASTSRSEEDSVGSFSFKIPEIGPNDSKDMTVPLKTKFKMYELPDWQNTTAEIEITSPAP